MRLVIDRITGEKADASTLYKAADGKYYTSKTAYDALLQERECRLKCLDLIGASLQYPEGSKLPTIAYKRLGELSPFGYSVVLQVIREHMRDIEWAMRNRDFRDDSGRVMYIFGIIKNNVGQKYRESKRVEKPNTPSVDYLSCSTETRNAAQKTRDISRFLEEGDD